MNIFETFCADMQIASENRFNTFIFWLQCIPSLFTITFSMKLSHFHNLLCLQNGLLLLPQTSFLSYLLDVIQILQLFDLLELKLFLDSLLIINNTVIVLLCKNFCIKLCYKVSLPD